MTQPALKPASASICFPGLVKWSKEQVDGFAGMFKEQVYVPDQDPAVIAEAVDVVRTLGRKLLYDIGLDLTFMFRDGLIDRRGSAASSVVPSRNPSPPPPTLPPPASHHAAPEFSSTSITSSTRGPPTVKDDAVRPAAGSSLDSAPQGPPVDLTRQPPLSADRPIAPTDSSAVSSASVPPPRPPRRDRARPVAGQVPADGPLSRSTPAQAND